MKNFLHNSDSTDLLLDAMCNVFGVVLIIAVAIGGVTISQKISDPGKVSEAELQDISSSCALQSGKLAAARSQRELLQSLLAKTPGAVGSKAHSQTINQHHSQLLDTVNNLADRIEAEDRKLLQALTLEERLTNSSEAEERARIARYSEALKQQNNIILPAYGKTAAKSLKPWRLLVDKDKFYIIGSNQDIYRGSDENSAVEINSFKQGKTRFFHIRKRPEKGIVLQDFSCAQTLPPPEQMKEYFIEISSETDAVAAAAFIISKLRQQNICFFWRTVPEHGAVLKTAEQGNYEVSR